jgi:hypothetical protein
MTDIKLLNNPEYRWNHKEEMSKIMPYISIRNELGIKVINYDKLRQEYLETIKEKKDKSFDWDKFRELVERVPLLDTYDKSLKKTQLNPADMYHFERRDGCECYMCGTVSRYTQFHHIIPYGSVVDDNIVTLCLHCHQLVHLALYMTKRWKFAMPK